MPLFRESQKFRQMWVLIPLIGLSFLFLWGTVQQVIFEIKWGSKPAPDSVLMLSVLGLMALIWLFYAMRLDTEITKQEIKIRFFPFLTRVFYLDEIEDAFVRQHAPIREFGGWGIRWGLHGMAYTISGKSGLQLVLKNGKKVLIGTQRPKELQQILEQLEF